MDGANEPIVSDVVVGMTETGFETIGLYGVNTRASVVGVSRTGVQTVGA